MLMFKCISNRILMLIDKLVACEESLGIVLFHLLGRGLANVDDEHIVCIVSIRNEHVEGTNVFDTHVLGKEQILGQRKAKPKVAVSRLRDTDAVEAGGDDTWHIP